MASNRMVTRMVSGVTTRLTLQQQRLMQQNLNMVNHHRNVNMVNRHVNMINNQQIIPAPAVDGGGDGETVEDEPNLNLEAGEDSSDEPEVGSHGAGPSNPRKRKRYHRHSQHQIREMESFFKDCPHPDDKQRRLLSRELALEPLQVKFWFQNKRTQMKMHHERHENTELRNNNEKLRAENIKFKNALNNSVCPSCGGPNVFGDMSFDEHNLRVENARLREEVERIANLASRNTSRTVNHHQHPHQQPRLVEDLSFFNPHVAAPTVPIQGPAPIVPVQGPNDFFRAVSGQQQQPIGDNQLDKQMIFQLAAIAMDELVQMAQMGEPLWVPSSDINNWFMNEEEYFRMFPRGFGPRPQNLKCEASRFTTVVIMNPLTLVELFFDVNNWKNFFASAVARASTLEILSTGTGNYNGALEVMSADFHVLSPLVSTRESFLARYCKQLGEGIWGVVDVSLDNLHPNTVLKCRRRPSGCIIQEMPNGCSKVTWVEHVEVDDRVTHTIYRPLVNSGLAFGAKRWLAILEKQCDRMANVLSMAIPPNSAVITSIEAKCSATKLTERMVTTYYGGVSASVNPPWNIVETNASDEIRVLIQRNPDSQSRPIGVILNASTSFWLPVPPKRVFDYIKNEQSRSEWDILSNAATVEELTNIPAGRESTNCISLLQMNGTMLILQETCWDPVGSYIVYAPIDLLAVNMVMSGGDSDFVALLPSGFVILPDGPSSNGSGPGGSLVTVSFQILVDPCSTAQLSMQSISTVHNLINTTMDRMKTVFLGQGELASS